MLLEPKKLLRSKKAPFIDSLPNIAISSDDLSIIESTKAYQKKLFELIRSAKKRIYITALYLQDDDAGKDVLNAIYQAKQNNPSLDVKVFVDFLRAQRGLMGHKESIGNIRLYQELNSHYRHAIDIYGVPIKNKEVFGVLHLKGFVFDHQLLYSGSSINNIYLHYKARYRYDRYHLIKSKRLTDCFVQFLNQHFSGEQAVPSLVTTDIPAIRTLKSFVRHAKIRLRRADYIFNIDNNADVDVNTDENSDDKNSYDINSNQAIKLTPLLGFGGRKNKLNQSIYQLIANTQKEVVIFTPYFNFPTKIYRAVRKLLKQGKKVIIVVGDKTANDFYIPPNESFNKAGILPYIYETSLKRFIKSNQKFVDNRLLDVCLWLDGGNSFHLKGINSDQCNYLITGHNINPRAWRLDIENGILIQDPQKLLINKFDSELKQIMKYATRINHFNEIDTPDDYPPEAKKLLKSVKRSKLDSLLNRLL